MAEPIALKDLIVDSVARAGRMILPSLPYAGLFILALGALVWGAGSLPEGGSGFLVFNLLAFGTLYAHSLFSASMYHAVLEPKSGLFSAAWKLSLAWILMIVVLAIGMSIIVLFFSLIGSSLGVGTSETGEDISDMAAQMREGGTFWPLFAVFCATLLGIFWFLARMMTFASASATRGTVHVFRTWYWTKGQFRVLGPAFVALIVLPIGLGSFIVQWGLRGIAGPDPIAGALAGLYAMLGMLILLPTAWLGHGLAASVYARLAPEMDEGET